MSRSAGVDEWTARSNYHQAESELEHLNEVWLERRAGGLDLSTVEDAIKESERVRRRSERRLRRLGVQP